MKIIVFSDSHGTSRSMERVMSLQSDASLVLFLGDGLRDARLLFSGHPEIPHLAVRGNCDPAGDGSEAEEAVIEWDGLRIFLCHGHTRGVKYGIETASAAARGKRADLLLFGHPHHGETGWIPGDPGEKPLCYLNPGSIREGSYGLIQVVNRQPLCSVATL